MPDTFQVISPVDGRVYLERRYTSDAEVARVLDRARRAQHAWSRVPLAERAAFCSRFVDAMTAEAPALAEEITLQMGRPIAHTPGELRGFAERADTMIEIAGPALADLEQPLHADFHRFIRRVPLGVVLVLVPWNYPYLTAVNAVVPAIMAGNVVVLKHAPQTARCAERLAEAFAAAELPEGVFQILHLTHDATAHLIESSSVDFVAFTGSVAGGLAVQRAARARFIGLGLELGGKDPAYVRPDAAFDPTVDGLVEGAFFNAGQSCCAVERIYVHRDLYDRFVDAFVAATERYRLGNPLDPDVDLGPLVHTAAADKVRAQVEDAIARGARPLIDPDRFDGHRPGTPYLAPQVLVGVDHTMAFMREETFGPAVGIAGVASDEEAIACMNDSRYGLTASIWTSSEAAALACGERLDTGTVFMNRCDYLDPALAWVGVKDSGRGCSLSTIGYEQLTRPKSFHLRTAF